MFSEENAGALEKTLEKYAYMAVRSSELLHTTKLALGTVPAITSAQLTVGTLDALALLA